MSKISINFVKLDNCVHTPEKTSEGAACYDIRAFLEKPVILKPRERFSIPTGIKVQIPVGFMLSVRPRSGLAIKEGLTLINSPGTIDSDFRGEIHILVINLGESEIKISNEERIAQLVLEKTYEIKWEVKKEDDLSSTKRGEGGFGSTGKK
ncbi:MAG: dUTP diphosphatase [Spirochaetia bacterium]|nr:dUTP diphosphatase [Spirochaetia bacterium]